VHGSLGLGTTPPLSARITLISHAPTEAQRRAAFPLDEPLDEREIAKVSALGWSAPRAQRIVSGPEMRVRQTAQALGLSAEVATALRDCDYGGWSGLDLSNVQSSKPEDVADWLTNPAAAPHGGESIVNFIGRTGRWLEEQREAGHTLAITNPALIRSAIIYVLEAPPHAFWRIDIAPLSLSDLRFNGRAWTVRSIGCPLQRNAGQQADEKMF
jgi:broad specificity phosphatase PhoE